MCNGIFNRKPWISWNFPAFPCRGFLGSPNHIFGGRWSWYVGQRSPPTQEPPPSPFWQLTRTMVWVSLGGNSDHGLSFLFSTDYSTFEFWRFKFSVVWVLVWVSSFYGDGGGSRTVNSEKWLKSDFRGLPQSNPKRNSQSDFLTWKLSLFGSESDSKSYFWGYFGGDPESHFLVTFEFFRGSGGPSWFQDLNGRHPSRAAILSANAAVFKMIAYYHTGGNVWMHDFLGGGLHTRSQKLQNSPELFEFSSWILPRISLRISPVLRFLGNGDLKKFTKNLCHFSMQNPQADLKKNPRKFSGKLTEYCGGG